MGNCLHDRRRARHADRSVAPVVRTSSTSTTWLVEWGITLLTLNAPETLRERSLGATAHCSGRCSFARARTILPPVALATPRESVSVWSILRARRRRVLVGTGTMQRFIPLSPARVRARVICSPSAMPSSRPTTRNAENFRSWIASRSRPSYGPRRTARVQGSLADRHDEHPSASASYGPTLCAHRGQNAARSSARQPDSRHRRAKDVVRGSSQTRSISAHADAIESPRPVRIVGDDSRGRDGSSVASLEPSATGAGGQRKGAWATAAARVSDSLTREPRGDGLAAGGRARSGVRSGASPVRRAVGDGPVG